MSPEEKSTPPSPPNVPIPKKSPGAETEGTKAPSELSAEEQMARYEESLKESDWGHQPC